RRIRQDPHAPGRARHPRRTRTPPAGLRTGGYIPSTDHQTPPDVSVEGFREYVRLLHEYCRKAV
ncbi:MAG TPA: hypothetical protein PK082_07605, partial [Phycisphaerae bacterium]|nr:hypothetical protein [Phycisphaerae bacterium]